MHVERETVKFAITCNRKDSFQITKENLILSTDLKDQRNFVSRIVYKFDRIASRTEAFLIKIRHAGVQCQIVSLWAKV